MIVWGAAAAAQRLPTLYDVAGIGTGDVLNVRDAPDADAPVIGWLAADARGVEVVAMDPAERWGQVNTAERAGWVAMRYLAAERDVWTPGRIPKHLTCYWTEPFWSLKPENGQAVFSTPEAGQRAFAPLHLLDGGSEGDPRRALVAGGVDHRLTATIVPLACTDSMSERRLGLDATLVVEGPDGRRLLTGCCSIAR